MRLACFASSARKFTRPLPENELPPRSVIVRVTGVKFESSNVSVYCPAGSAARLNAPSVSVTVVRLP
jgi:hypothetical protein